MNAIKSLRRVSPLAIIFVALAAVLALTPSAHAQSSLATQLEPLVMWPGYAAKATPTGEVVVAPDNDADFTQRWERVTVNSSTFRFSRFGFNSCIRVPAGLSPSVGAPVQVGSCSGTLAQWRQVSIPGVGDGYTNVATGHYLTPPLCLFTCDLRVRAQSRPDVENALGLDFIRWRLDTTF